MLLTQWHATSAHHSPPRPPPGDSADDNHTALLPEYTLALLTASRKTHPPAAQSKGETSCYLFIWFTVLLHTFLVYLTWACCGCCWAGCGWGVWQVAVVRVEYALPWERDVIQRHKPPVSVTYFIPEDNLSGKQKIANIIALRFPHLSAPLFASSLCMNLNSNLLRRCLRICWWS